MRVLHIIPGKLFGGVEAAMITTARFRDCCPEMATEVAVCWRGRLSEELEAAGTPVHLLGGVQARNPLTVLRARRRLRGLLRRERFEVVVCHMPWVQAIFGPVVRSEGVPLAFRAHGPVAARHWTERWAAMTAPDIAICVSRFVADSLATLYPDVPTAVVYNPVAPAEPISQAERGAIRAEGNTPENAVVIAQAGRMQPGKGQQILLEALGLSREVPGWRCWQIGGAQTPPEERYMESLRAQAARLGISERVHFWGQRSDVARVLGAADVYCQPNDTFLEGMGIAFVEAMQAGLPVVTTAIGAATEVVHESCGLLLPPKDVSAVATALEGLMRDPSLCSKLGSAARLTVAPHFAAEVQIPRLYEGLNHLIRTNRVAPRAGMKVACVK
jgi:glycosyltransferase involved in cell wall biosynthesis